MGEELTTAVAATPEISNLFVVVMGLVIVFVGLICIILLCYLMSYVVRQIDQKKPAAPAVADEPAAAAPQAIENRGELVAAISAAIAEELGKDVSGIRILSIKRL